MLWKACSCVLLLLLPVAGLWVSDSKSCSQDVAASDDRSHRTLHHDDRVHHALHELESARSTLPLPAEHARRLWDGRLAYRHLPRHSKQAAATSQNWAVCIVGQLLRLEVESKVKNIINALRRDPAVEVDVYVVLEVDGNYFSNPSTRYGGPLCERDRTPEDVEAAFADWYRGGLYVLHNSSTNWLHPEHFPHWNQPWNLGLNIQQFTHIASCFDLMREMGRAEAYTDFLRVRDGAIGALPVEHLGNSSHIQVKDAAGWGGYNDKVLYAPGPLIEAATTNPLQLLRDANEGVESAVRRVQTLQNTEQVLRASLSGLPVQQVPADRLPIVDGRCVDRDGAAHYCLVDQWKDSYPAGQLFARACRDLV